MNNHDKLIVNIFFRTKRLRFSLLKTIEKYHNILDYLHNRYNDGFDSIQEILWRIYYGIEKRPTCEICGSYVKWYRTNEYHHACCKFHAYQLNKIKRLIIWKEKYGKETTCPVQSKEVKEKIKKTCLKKYGVTTPFKSEEIKEKIKQTCIEKYGVSNPNKLKEVRQKIKQTCVEKYGVDNFFKSKEMIIKSKETYKEKYGVDDVINCSQIPEIYNRKRLTWEKIYGVDHPFKSDKIKKERENTWINKYGVDNIAKSKEIREKIINTNLQRYGFITPAKNKKVKEKLSETWNKEETKQKQYNTKKKNHSFNISKPEEELYLYIKERFPNVKRQYKDKERYPYSCDFYIPSLDYFIELQGYYTHGKHPFNPNSTEDLELIEKYKSKYGPKCQPITIWSIKDVEKRECAKKHNLNFKEVWTLEEGKEFINTLIK